MDFHTLSTYSIETAGTLVLVVIAYKIYKLRVTSFSSCCDDHFALRTVSRGDSSTDLPLYASRPRSLSMTELDIRDDTIK